MPSAAGGPQTLYDKILADHVVDEKLDGTILLYIGMQNPGPTSRWIPRLTLRTTDRHLVHEVTSPVRITILRPPSSVMDFCIRNPIFLVIWPAVWPC